MTLSRRRPHQLQRRHFAFMRALLQGLDARASWTRYLRAEGEGSDLRTVRRTIDWIRDAFAAAARRADRPGTARLVLMDPERLPVAPALPTLEAFAAERGLEDFSEEEQAEAYLDVYPEAAGGKAGQGRAKHARVPQKARLIARQLEALRWLESLAAQDPSADDGVAAWLNPGVAHRLEMAGLRTLRAVVEIINARGARWWREVPGVGPLKAARVVAWLRDQEDIAGLLVGRHASTPRAQLSVRMLDAVVPAATALVPFEKFVVPPALDGRDGWYRAPVTQCLLCADHDHAAITAWLTAKAKPSDHLSAPIDAARALTATQRAYRKEAERLLLWCVLERQRPLSSLSAEDANAYKAFLANPPARWCGPRHHQRWSPLWRPLEGPLSVAAQGHAFTVLHALFAFLVSKHYLVGNPFAAAPPRPAPVWPLGWNRTLSFAQWDRVEARLRAQPDTEPARRLVRAVRWLYATGLRLGEITAARCSDLQTVPGAEGAAATEWLLQVPGKGHRFRQVPVPCALVQEFEFELGRHGHPGSVRAAANAGVAILSRFDAPPAKPVLWSASALYKAVKRVLTALAASSDEPDASQFLRVSAHWLRHTHGTHALRGRTGAASATLRMVRRHLGHASISTTAAYLVVDPENHPSALRGQ